MLRDQCELPVFLRSLPVVLVRSPLLALKNSSSVTSHFVGLGTEYDLAWSWFLLEDVLDARLQDLRKAVEAGALEVGKAAGDS